MLQARLIKKRDRFTLDISIELKSGILVLVGESGSGKTTVLRLLAGLESPDSGHIRLNDTKYFEANTTHVPPEHRSVGYVSQNYALFPHLTVFENVAFGPRAIGCPVKEIRIQVSEILQRFSIQAFSNRYPDQLSGGQRQRVALARALILKPKLLLLDEPLSALDLLTRKEVRAELKQILQTESCLTVYVTHQPQEAFHFGGNIAVLDQGRVAQEGSRFLAEFMGTPSG